MTQLIVYLHVAVSAAWIGAALWVSGDVRRTLARGRPHVDALAARVSPALRFDLVLGGTTVVTGLVLFLVQGPVAHRHGILFGLALALVRLGLVGIALGPAWRKVEEAIGAGDLAAAAAPAKRMAMYAGIGHVLWLGALAGMIFGSPRW